MGEKQPYSELERLKEQVFLRCHLTLTKQVQDNESSEYAACQFNLNDQQTLFRVAKQTPKKVGQFVTLWRRSSEGPISPFHQNDHISLTIICARSGNHFGHFVFPSSTLVEKGIFSTGGKEGKRGFRIYPPWDSPTSQRAKKTQAWQLDYFLEIPHGGIVDLKRAQKLYAGC